MAEIHCHRRDARRRPGLPGFRRLARPRAAAPAWSCCRRSSASRTTSERRARDLRRPAGYVVVRAAAVLAARVPDVELPENTPEGLQQAFGYMQQPRRAAGGRRTRPTALAHLRATAAQTGGRAGVIRLLPGWAAGVPASAPSAEPDVVVSYYGSGIGSLLERAAQTSRRRSCSTSARPTQYLPMPRRPTRIGAAFADRRGRRGARARWTRGTPSTTRRRCFITRPPRPKHGPRLSPTSNATCQREPDRSMDYEVVVEHASARQLAAVRGTVPALSEIGSTIIRLLDQVWPVLQAPGHANKPQRRCVLRRTDDHRRRRRGARPLRADDDGEGAEHARGRRGAHYALG